MKIVPASLDHPEARRLTADVQRYYALIYGGADSSPMSEREFDAPHGRFFLAVADGQSPAPAVGMGGWRRRPDLDDRCGGVTVELKRMYVAPAWRRRGVSARILDALETEAAEAGAEILVLETGTAQPEAIAFYESRGYALVDNFGHYAWSDLSRCFAKRLPLSATDPASH